MECFSEPTTKNKQVLPYHLNINRLSSLSLFLILLGSRKKLEVEQKDWRMSKDNLDGKRKTEGIQHSEEDLTDISKIILL